MNNVKLRYIAYVRKSEERAERQELSHPAQIKEIKERFPDLNIIKWMEPESKSAFKPGRPIFNEMMDMIDQGKADGILAYYPNRIARNELDSGRITYALRSNLKDLKFCSYNFENTPEGILMLQQFMAHGQYESSKQGREVKRGMTLKAEGGERPGNVMPGYMKVAVLDSNGRAKMKKDKVVTETDIDPDRYEAISKAWKLFINDRQTPQQIWKVMNNIYDYKTRTYTKRKDGSLAGGGPMPKSMIYRIFRSPFYAGYFEHNGVLQEGNHKPMITWEEYKLAQELLGPKGNLRLGTFDYAFASLIRCGECGCLVQAMHRTKFIKSENRYKTYVYYYCSRKSMKRPCTQTVYTAVEDIERDIANELSKYTIIPEFKELALKILRRNHKLEAHERNKVYGKLLKRRSALQEELDSLIDYLHRELLDEDEYKRKRSLLKVEIVETDKQLRGNEKTADEAMVRNETAFNFAVHAKINFQNGDIRTKRDVLRTLGENLILKDNKLYIEPNKWLVPIAEGYSEIEKAYLKVRTNKKATTKQLEAAMEPIFESWRARWDSNPRHPA